MTLSFLEEVGKGGMWIRNASNLQAQNSANWGCLCNRANDAKSADMGSCPMGNFTVDILTGTGNGTELMEHDGAEDCSYYLTSLAVLAAFVSDQIVEAWEVPPCAMCHVQSKSITTC